MAEFTIHLAWNKRSFIIDGDEHHLYSSVSSNQVKSVSYAADDDFILNFIKHPGKTFDAEVTTFDPDSVDDQGNVSHETNEYHFIRDGKAPPPSYHVIEGTSGDDNLIGTRQNDKIIGGAGRDVERGGAGNDLLKGGSGNDRLNGGAGNDILNGGSGNDIMRGDDGNNIFYTGTGNNMVIGGDGNDTTHLGGGANIVRMSHGVDMVYGWKVDIDHIQGPQLHTNYTTQDEYTNGHAEGNDWIVTRQDGYETDLVGAAAAYQAWADAHITSAADEFHF